MVRLMCGDEVIPEEMSHYTLTKSAEQTVIFLQYPVSWGIALSSIPKHHLSRVGKEVASSSGEEVSYIVIDAANLDY